MSVRRILVSYPGGKQTVETSQMITAWSALKHAAIVIGVAELLLLLLQCTGDVKNRFDRIT